MPSTATTAQTKHDNITASDSAEMMTTIKNYGVTDTSGKTAPSMESWYFNCASTCLI
jgi:hypothetical protein